MKSKKSRVALSILLTILILLTRMFPNFTVEAEAKIDSESIVKTYSGYVNGIERNLIITKTEYDSLRVYIQMGEEESELLFIGILDAAFDKYGSVWVLDSLDKTIYWWNYDLTSDDATRWFQTVPNRNDPVGYVHDVDSFIYEGSGTQAIIVGYKTTSGEINSLLTFAEMKAIVAPDSSVSEPSYVPKEDIPTQKPIVSETPTLAPPTVSETLKPTLAPPTQKPIVSETPKPTLVSPTQKPTISETPKPTSAPPTQKPIILETPKPTLEPPTQSVLMPTPNPSGITVRPTITPKVYIKKSKKKPKTYSLYEGDKKVIEYTLKKATLTWRINKKRGKVKGIKYAGFIKKRKTLIFMDKKGRVYTVSSKSGKQKRLTDIKKPKKFIYQGKFVIKVKTAHGNTNVRYR